MNLQQSGYFTQRRRQPGTLRRDRHGYDFPALFGQVAAYRPSEIFIQRIESIRLEFAKYLAEFLLDSVHVVKESPPVHIQAAAAQLPVRAQKVVEFENPVFFFVQNPPADQAKISHIFLIFTTPDHTAVFAAYLLQTNRADVLLFGNALPESGIACLEDSSQNAIAGRCRALSAASTQSVTLTLRARFLRQREDFSTAPV